VRTWIAVLAMACLTSACGMSSGPIRVAQSVATAAKSGVSSSRVTQVGNPYGAGLLTFDRGTANPTIWLNVRYSDKVGFFSRFNREVNAYARVIIRGQQPQELHLSDVAKSSGENIRIQGVSKESDILAVELAFHVGGKWDSNNGRNYTIDLHR
jgi:hypothetical protein